ncbi:MAG: hypothetical protein KIT83_19460 [Bryobacterales bacterium]|nr:hypothetical protein [Bryobacterales bacterium]
MTRAELEAKIADYLDGTLAETEVAAFEQYLPLYPDLAELVQDAGEAMEMLKQVDAPEPPPAFYARLEIAMTEARRSTRRETRNAGIFTSLAAFFAPMLQPRFVMGMAMTILSVSMIGQLTGTRIDQVSASDLKPAAIWSAVGYRAERVWDRATKYYESLRVVYEMRTRVQEWTDQLEQERQRAASRLGDPETELNSPPDTVPPDTVPPDTGQAGADEGDKPKDKLKE